MNAQSRVCVICDRAEEAQNPFCYDGLDDDVAIHIKCWGSEDANAWREQLRATDPAYDRSLRLMTLREPVTCPHCRVSLEMSPKAVGMGAGYGA
jgi:hypothetical protein